ncbi:zinc knuckle CX2CX4HX4C containing protein, partial [Tanacetum coccineum]
TNTPYPSRKIRRIRACTHQRPQKIKDQYAVSRGLNTPYSRYGINIIFWKISNVVPTPRNPQYAGNPQMDLQDQGVIDSGCSRYMTRNMSYLTDYEEIDGGYVAFGGNLKGRKVTGKANKSVRLIMEKLFGTKLELILVTQIDGKKIIVTKSTVRRDIQLEDAEGIDCLPNSTIFEELTRMGSKTTAWNEFSSTMASAIICLTRNQKFNFSKYIFEKNAPISNQDPNSFPPLKKVDSILKPKKTTRTMNPDSGDTMKHRTMLGRSAQVSFKERVTRSSSKKGGSVMDMDEEGCDEDVLKSGGDGDDVSIMDEAKLMFGSICKDPKVSVNANVSGMPGVSVDSATVNDVYISNNGLGSNGNDFVPEIPVLFDMNPILNPNGNNNHSSSGSKVNVKEVKVPGMFRIVGDDSMLNKGSMYFASAVSKSFGGFGNNKLKYVSTTWNDEGMEVAVMDPVLEEGTDKWCMIVVGNFVEFQMGYREIIGHLKRMWRLYQLEEVIVNQGMYYFNFKLHEGMQCVIENGPWMVENKPLFVRISRIASRIGVPIIMDKIMTSICEKPYGRASYARVLVEVDAAKGLVESVEIWYKSLGKSMMLSVEYVWRPSLCDHCKTFGHFSKFCSKAQASVDKENRGEVKVKSNMSAGNVNNDQDGWQNVDYRRENLSKYVPVKNNEKVVNVDECLVTDEVMQTKPSTGAVKLSKEDVVNDGLGNRGSNGKSNGVNGKESIGMDDISMTNRFDVLIEENEEEVLDTWEDVRIQVLSACNSRVPIEEEENLCSRIVQLKSHRHVNARRSALQLVKETDETTSVKSNKSLFDEYFSQCCREIDIKVKELQWDKRRFEVDLFIMSKKVLSDDVKQAWTDDMADYFLERCEEIKNDEKNGHYTDDGVQENMEEVGDDTSGSASFLTQNEVINGVDTSMAQMQGGLAGHPSNFQ